MVKEKLSVIIRDRQSQGLSVGLRKLWPHYVRRRARTSHTRVPSRQGASHAVRSSCRVGSCQQLLRLRWAGERLLGELAPCNSSPRWSRRRHLLSLSRRAAGTAGTAGTGRRLRAGVGPGGASRLHAFRADSRSGPRLSRHLRQAALSGREFFPTPGVHDAGLPLCRSGTANELLPTLPLRPPSA